MRKKNHIEASRAAFSIILGQCTKELHDRMETFKEWGNIKDKCDVIKILQLIRSATYAGSATKKDTVTYIEAEQALIYVILPGP